MAVIGELTNDDGTMARLPECQVFARRHGMKLITIEALVAWRKEHEQEFFEAKKAKKATKQREKKEKHVTSVPAVEVLAECTLPIHRDGKDLGEWTLRCYLSHLDNLRRHIVLIKGLTPASILSRSSSLSRHQVMLLHWLARNLFWFVFTPNASLAMF